MNNPILSIVIPTRNRHLLAEEALRSALLPLPFSVEIILSDNASTDSTSELAALFPGVRYVRRKKLLPMAAHWNVCVSECQGKYVKLLCDDDVLLAGALEREVSALERDSTLSLVASARNEVAEDGKTLFAVKRWAPEAAKLEGEDLFFKNLLWENLVGPPSGVSFRRDFFTGFPETLEYAADWGAWLKLGDNGGFLLLPEPGVNFRIHSSSLTPKYVAEGTDFLEVQSLRRNCLRRLSGLRFVLGVICFAWIYFYRLGRRILRYLVRARFSELSSFLRRIFLHTA